jgi:hypothetical protein
MDEFVDSSIKKDIDKLIDDEDDATYTKMAPEKK